MNFEIGEGVYAIRCSATNSYYYGNTNDIRTRYSKHNWYLKRGRHPNRKLQEDFNRFGVEAFEFIMIAGSRNKEERAILEYLLITEGRDEGQSVYNAYLPVLGYGGKQKALKDAVVRNDYTDIIVRNYLQEVA